MYYKNLLTVILAMSLVVLAACARPQDSARRVSLSAAGLATDVSSCQVVQVETGLTITREDAGLVGGTAGAIAGGIAGSQFGGGRGQDLLTLGGSILGGLIGSDLENYLSSLDGVRYTIRRDEDGRLQNLVQVIYDNEQILQSGQACLLESYPFNPTCYNLTGDTQACASRTPYQRVLPFGGVPRAAG